MRTTIIKDGDDMLSFIKYIKLCLEVGYKEYSGEMSQQEADDIVMDYLNKR